MSKPEDLKKYDLVDRSIKDQDLIEFTDMFLSLFIQSDKVKAAESLIKEGELLKPTFGGIRRSFQLATDFRIDDKIGPIDVRYTIHLTANRVSDAENKS